MLDGATQGPPREPLPRRVPGLGRPSAHRARRLLLQGGRRDRGTRGADRQDMTAEMGKPLREARMEAARAAAILRYSAGEAYWPAGELYQPSIGNQALCTRRRPVGSWA